MNAGLGERPEFDALAPWGTNDTFLGPRIDVSGRIRRGTNVLAIQGINSSPASSDFSLVPVLCGGLKNRKPDAERIVDLSRHAREGGNEHLVAYLDGRLLELEGEYDDAIRQYWTAAGTRADDPRPVARLMDCLTALGRKSQAESRLRSILVAGARSLDGVWIERCERQGLGQREILRDRRKGATPPTTLLNTTEADVSRAMRVDLAKHFNADVVSLGGDLEADFFDAGQSRLVIFRRGLSLMRGVPDDRRGGVHQLAPYRDKNAVQISAQSRDPVGIDVPRGRYDELRFLVCGGSRARKVSSLSAWLEFTDGRRRRVSIPCPDASWLKDPRHGLPERTAVAWGCMDGQSNGYVEMHGDFALYEVTVAIHEDSDLVAVEIDPRLAEFQDDRTRLNIFAITALERAR